MRSSTGRNEASSKIRRPVHNHPLPPNCRPTHFFATPAVNHTLRSIPTTVPVSAITPGAASSTLRL